MKTQNKQETEQMSPQSTSNLIEEMAKYAVWQVFDNHKQVPSVLYGMHFYLNKTLNRMRCR